MRFTMLPRNIRRPARGPLGAVALAASLSLVLAACGGGTDDAAATCEPGRTDGDRLLYNWADYIDPGLIQEF